jgi:hypothetical protein
LNSSDVILALKICKPVYQQENNKFKTCDDFLEGEKETLF